MDIERLVVRLMADASVYTHVLDSAEARAVYFAGAVTEAFVRSAVVSAAAFERAALSFEVMTRNADKGRKILADINQLAVESPFHSEELVTYAKELVAFGFDANDTTKILGTLGDVAAGTGGRMDRLVLAFGQVRTAGRLMGQEVRQFTNAGVPLLEYLAKTMNKPVDQITNMVHRGKIGYPEVVKAFNAMTAAGGVFDGMTERINRETVSGRWENMVERFQLASRNVALAAFKGLDLGSLIDKVGSFAEGGNLSDIEDTFRGIRGAFQTVYVAALRAYTVVSEFISKVSIPAPYLRMAAAVLAIGLAFRTVAFAVTIATAAVRTFFVISSIVSGFGALLSVVANLGAVLGLIVSPLGLFLGTLVAVVAVLNQIGALEGIGDHLLDAFRKLGPLMAGAWDGIVGAVKGGQLELATDIAFGAIDVAWKTLIASMQVEWMRFTSQVVNKFKVGGDIQAGSKLMMNDLGAWLERQFTWQMFQGEESYNREMDRIENLRKQTSDQILKQNLTTTLNQMEEVKRRTDEIMRRVEGPKEELLKLTTGGRVAGLLGEQYTNQFGLFDTAKKMMGYYDRLYASGERERHFGSVGDFSKLQPPPIELRPELYSYHAAEHALKKYTDLFREAAFRIGVLQTLVANNAHAKEVDLATQDAKKAIDTLREFADSIRIVDQAAQKARRAQLQPLPVLSGRARDAVNDLNKALDEGLTPMEKFTNTVEGLQEAFRGPNPALGALLGVGPTMDQKLGQMGIIDAEQRRTGYFRAYQQLMKSYHREERLPPAAFRGTQQAQDIINRERNQQVDEQSQIIANLIVANRIAEEEKGYAQRTAIALEKLLAQPGPIKK